MVNANSKLNYYYYYYYYLFISILKKQITISGTQSDSPKILAINIVLVLWY